MSDNQPEKISKVALGVGNCLLGSAISGGLGVGLYFLTSSIAEAFARTPVTTTNPTAINISIAVRTLVMGVAALGTGVFALIAVGLLALAVQTLFQSSQSPSE